MLIIHLSSEADKVRLISLYRLLKLRKLWLIVSRSLILRLWVLLCLKIWIDHLVWRSWKGLLGWKYCGRLLINIILGGKDLLALGLLRNLLELCAVFINSMKMRDAHVLKLRDQLWLISTVRELTLFHRFLLYFLIILPLLCFPRLLFSSLSRFS